MAVVSSFTASKLTGLVPPSESVQFTDTSTGSPDSWLWNFGDGNYSSDPDPVHSFTGGFNSKFTVTLTAWIADTSSAPSASVTNTTRGPATDTGSNAAAYDLWLAQGWVSNTPNVIAFMGTEAGSGATYLGGRKSYSATLPSVTSTTAAMLVEYKLTSFDAVMNRTISEQHGSFYVEESGSTLGTIPSTGSIGVWLPGASIISLAGQAVNLLLYPNDGIIEPLLGGGQQKGFMSYSRLIHYKSASADNKDDSIQIVEFIGPEDVSIDFVGTPLTGTSPLAVQFTDLSVVSHALSVWNFGDGNSVTFAGETHPLNTYTTDSCSLDLL